MINVYNYKALLNAYPPAKFRFEVTPPLHVQDRYGLSVSYLYAVIGSHWDAYDDRLVIDVGKVKLHED
jgi:hypothetical protein